MNQVTTREPTQYLESVWISSGTDESPSKWHVFRQLSEQAWRSFLAAPVTSLLTLITIAVALSILGFFLLIVQNLTSSLDATKGELKLAIYFREGVNEKEIWSLRESLLQDPKVLKVQYLSKEEALNRFKKSLGSQSTILDGLEVENPLPPSLDLTFKGGAATSHTFEELSLKLQQLPIVELTHYNRGVIGEMADLARGFRFWGGIAIAFLMLVTGFIIANTIRLALHAHRQEIEIMRLVGATDQYVRAPYIIEGGVQGLIGAILSLSLVWAVGSVLIRILQNDPTLRLLVPEFTSLSWGSIFLTLLLGVSVGVAGSWLAVRRFIRATEIGSL